MYKTILISILALAFIGGFLFFYKPKPEWEARSDDQANVTVTVTPFVLSIDSKEWKFDIVLNTHSVELDQDMTKISILVDDGGKEYNAVRWEGGEPGGHHREGVLVFNSISPVPEFITLKIMGIALVERNFTWQLQ